MRDRPSGAELLRLAREALRDLVHELPEERRYTALMVANAMAIAARELDAGDEPPAEMEALRDILGEKAKVADPVRALAGALRGGRLDGDETVHAWLSQEVIDRLKISNPKRLQSILND